MDTYFLSSVKIWIAGESKSRETRTGLSGLIVVIGTPLICFPMIYWKKALPYEVRKALHYLFYLFAIVSLL